MAVFTLEIGRTNRLTVWSTNVNSRRPTPLISRQISHKSSLFLLDPFLRDGQIDHCPSECEFRSDFGRLVRQDGQIVFKKSSSQTDNQAICPSRRFVRLLV